MATPEALNALADRVEREEPSRTLDVEIARVIEPDRPWSKYDPNLPRFTVHLDAAVTLVPEGASWDLQVYRGHADAIVVYEDNEDKPDLDAEASAATPAAALTAAALRARAALKGGE
jgi:hypothetical protein